MPLTRSQAVATLSAVLASAPDAEFRLVGTASCLLRGIDLPAGDIDILFRRRSDLDGWFTALRRRHHAERPPRWLPDETQYFAELIVDGVKVELSTVERDDDDDTTECFGRGPWQHFDVLDVDGSRAPAVAVELRLITEIIRGRPDRVNPIVEHVRDSGCDLDLVRRGLLRRDVEADVVTRWIDRLTPAQGSHVD